MFPKHPHLSEHTGDAGLEPVVGRHRFEFPSSDNARAGAAGMALLCIGAGLMVWFGFGAPAPEPLWFRVAFNVFMLFGVCLFLAASVRLGMDSAIEIDADGRTFTLEQMLIGRGFPLLKIPPTAVVPFDDVIWLDTRPRYGWELLTVQGSIAGRAIGDSTTNNELFRTLYRLARAEGWEIKHHEPHPVRSAWAFILISGLLWYQLHGPRMPTNPTEVAIVSGISLAVQFVLPRLVRPMMLARAKKRCKAQRQAS